MSLAWKKNYKKGDDFMFEFLGAVIAGVTAIGAAISTVGATVGTALSAAGAFLGGLASKIGPLITKFADNFLGVVAKIPEIDLDTIEKVIDTAGNIIHSVCGILGINSEENVEILGAKAEQAEKTLADFDNDTEAYIKYLKEEIELDKEEFDQMSEGEKMGCKAVGIALETKAVEEKIGGVKIPPECVVALAKIHMCSDLVLNAKELVDLINGMKEAGITDMNDIVELLEGKGNSDRVKTDQIVRSVLEKMDIGNDIDEVVGDMKQAVRRFGQK